MYNATGLHAAHLAFFHLHLPYLCEHTTNISEYLCEHITNINLFSSLPLSPGSRRLPLTKNARVKVMFKNEDIASTTCSVKAKCLKFYTAYDNVWPIGLTVLLVTC